MTELLQLVREVGYKFKVRRNIAEQAERQAATHARDAACAAFSSTFVDDKERMVLLLFFLLRAHWLASAHAERFLNSCFALHAIEGSHAVEPSVMLVRH